MMNRPVIAVVLLVLSILISISSLIFIEINCDSVIKTLDKALDCAYEKNYNETEKQLQIALEKLEKSKHFFNIIIGQEETVEIRNNLNKAIFYYNKKNYDSMTLYLQDCKMNLNRIIVTSEPII